MRDNLLEMFLRWPWRAGLNEEQKVIYSLTLLPRIWKTGEQIERMKKKWKSHWAPINLCQNWHIPTSFTSSV